MLYFTHAIENSPTKNPTLALTSILNSRTILKSKGNNQRQSKLEVVYGRVHKSLSDVYKLYKNLGNVYKYVLVFDFVKIKTSEPELGTKLINYDYNVPNPPTVSITKVYEMIYSNKSASPLSIVGFVENFKFSEDYLEEVLIIRNNSSEELDNNLSSISSIISSWRNTTVKVINSFALEEEYKKTEEEKISDENYNKIWKILTNIEKNYFGDICTTYTNEKYIDSKQINKIITKLQTTLITCIPKLNDKHKKSIIKILVEFRDELIPRTIEIYTNDPVNNCHGFLFNKPDLDMLNKKTKSVLLLSQMITPILAEYISQVITIGIKCNYCAKSTANFICGKCNNAFYCDSDCQKYHWTGKNNAHKYNCY